MTVSELTKLLMQFEDDLDIVAAGFVTTKEKEFHIVFDLEDIFLNEKEGYVEVKLA